MSEIDDLPLGNPARSALAASGITTLAEAATRTRAEVAALHGVGPRALTVLEAALAERGLSFADPAAALAEETSTEEAPADSAPGEPAPEPLATAGAEAVTPPPAVVPSAPPAAGPAPAVRYNAFAIVALVTAFVVPPLGIVFGHLALRELRAKPELGREMAIAGLVIGYVFTALIALVVLIWLGAFVAILGTFLTLLPIVGAATGGVVSVG